MFQVSISDCKRWLSGHCFFENTCHFKHDSVKQDLKSNVKKVISSCQSINCQYWLRKSCKLQNNCWYQHDSEKKNSILKDLNATDKKNANLFSSYIFFLILLHTISKLIFFDLSIIEKNSVFCCAICFELNISDWFTVLLNCIHKFHLN